MPSISGFNPLVILGAVYLVFAAAFLFPFRRQTSDRKIAM